ncbi:hypothetical protein [Nocardioides sp. W7]|uniref:hypothetical protein n=1 Tax=Nocardioides sp. W7 TaxID=2931390 RepID=UPI001FD1929B|nr:hypothetical protein [Nocardioides sp. W7]
MTVWGVYAIQGRTPDGRTVAENDKAAARWFVRWRVDEVLKKRTFPTKGSGISIYLASDWAGHSTDVAELC